MTRHKFRLLLSGLTTLSSGLANTLHEATAGEIEFEMHNGIASLEFVRAAPSLREAILSAIRDVEEADLGIRVVRVESEAANTTAKINAELLGTTSGLS
jgi:hypothetical protein